MNEVARVKWVCQCLRFDDLEEVNLIRVNSIVIYYNINYIVPEQRIV